MINQNHQKKAYTVTFDTSQANINCFIRNKLQQKQTSQQSLIKKCSKSIPEMDTSAIKSQKFQQNIFLESVLNNGLNQQFVNSHEIKELIEKKDNCFSEDEKNVEKIISTYENTEDLAQIFSIIEPKNRSDINYKSIIYSCQLDNLNNLNEHQSQKMNKNESYSTYQNSFSVRSQDFQNYPYYQPLYQFGGFYHSNQTNYQYPVRKKKGSGEEGDYKIILPKVQSDGRTTIMIRHIPNKYTQNMLLQQINRNHRLKFNFLYLPIDYSNSCNVGYAFINFIHAKFIIEFHKEFSGKRWNKFNSEKICQLTYARIQGTTSLLDHFQNSLNRDKKTREQEEQNRIKNIDRSSF